VLHWSGDQYAEYERIRDLDVAEFDDALEDTLDIIERLPSSQLARSSRFESVEGRPTVWIADAPPGRRTPIFRIYWQEQDGDQLILFIEDLS
jgi:hypothetical protein